MTSVATLIGDVVGSRSAADRRGLHARLEEVIATINATTDPVHPVRITVGDEVIDGSISSRLAAASNRLPD